MSEPERWPARRSRGGDAALYTSGALLLLALLAFVAGAFREPDWGMLGLCLVAAGLALLGGGLLLWALAYRRLTYQLTAEALRIVWLGRTTVVPYSTILGIYTGQRLQNHVAARGPRWPGINVGQARVRGLGRLLFFATTTDPTALTLITVQGGGVVLTARDPAAFRSALIDAVEAGPDDETTVAITPAITPPWTALRDTWLPPAALAGAVLVFLILGLIVARFDALPDPMPLRFEAGGLPSYVGPKSDVLRVPLIGFGVLLLDWALGIWIHPREAFLGRLLWIGGAVVQLVLLVGVMRLVA